MSTYTSNSGFEKPIPGSQEGTWGGTVNTNFDLIDEAINGIASPVLTTAGTSGSPNTIEVTDGASSTGRHAFVDFDDNGSLAGADVYVQLTETGGSVDAERIMWIKNSLTSGDNLYLFQGTYSAARDYVIPNGQTVLVRFTGGGVASNCFVLPILENVRVDGTITATGDITGNNLSGTNTGDNPGVTSVDTSGALSGGPITGTGTITHLNTNGYKHIPSDGSVGQFVKWAAAGSGTWATLATTDVSGYQTPAMYDNAGTPTLNAGITAAEYRTAIGAGTSSTTGTVTQVDGGNGLTGSVTTSGALAVGAGQGIVVNADSVQLDYTGTNNFINVATDLEGTAIALTDTIIYHDATDNNIKKGLISDLPGIGSSGTVSSVASGNGMDFTEITGTGTVTMGTPGSITDTSTNSTTATSHTHAVSHTGSGSFVMAVSPTLTGTPLAPTQAVGNNSTRIATTAFVNAEIANDAPLKDGTGATGTWGISITGNASTAGSASSATSATTAGTVTGAAQTAITSVGTLLSLDVTGEIQTNNALAIKERAGSPASEPTIGKIWVKNTVPSELWYTDDAGGVHQLGVENTATGTVTSVSAGTGMSFTTITDSGSVSLDYSGSDNFCNVATDSTVSSSDYIIYHDVSANAVRKDTVSALPFTNNIGDITGVTAGDGLTGGATSGTATVTMGTPGSLTDATTNAVTATSHTHAITFPVPTLITVATTAATTTYPMLATSSTGDLAPKTDAGLSYNASTNTLTAGTLNASSARHLKTQVGVPHSADDLKRLNPIFYTLNADETKQVHTGYFADEVVDYFPEMVGYDDDGRPASIDYSRFVVPLIMKVTELEREIEKLRAA